MSSESRRIHMSKQPIESLRKAVVKQTPEFKPRGLWYACGDEWLEWVRTEMPTWMSKNFYEVVLSPEANILFIKDSFDMSKFEKKYNARINFIDWPKVAQDYDGIEICPYNWGERMNRMWYYGWDVASGCIWNTHIVKELRELGDIS